MKARIAPEVLRNGVFLLKFNSLTIRNFSSCPRRRLGERHGCHMYTGILEVGHEACSIGTRPVYFEPPTAIDERTYGPPRESKSLSPLLRRHGAWRGLRASRRLAVHWGQGMTRGPVARRASGRDESADQPEAFPLRAAGDGKAKADLLRRLNPSRALNGLWPPPPFLP